ncbi:MAG: hypothetical protein HOP08_18610 [Cyclobacteriaceae bacterium]|nr:hypothetical protein [Cyclobacteriaceae bacterium]
MYSKSWLIIKDDSKRTFEICGQETNTNYFTNNVYGMQKAGMNVSGITPSLTNKNSSKELVKVPGYTLEVGLEKRLAEEYRKITMGAIEDW